MIIAAKYPAFIHLFIEKAGTSIGKVTSAVYSPRLERNIGFILCDIAYAQPGTRLQVETPEGRRGLEVVEMPFLDRDKSIPRRPLRDPG